MFDKNDTRENELPQLEVSHTVDVKLKLLWRRFFFLRLQPGIKPATSRSRVRRSNNRPILTEEVGNYRRIVLGYFSGGDARFLRLVG